MMRASLASGWHRSRALWSLVVAVWLVQIVLLLPASVLLDQCFDAVLTHLPDQGAAPGDLLLIAAEVLPPLLPALQVALLAGAILLWQWGVVWRAGVVAWQLWAGGGPTRLSQVVGLGLSWWWPYLRLSLCSLAVVIVVGFVLWFPLARALWSAYNQMAEERLLPLVVLGLLLTVVLWVVAWGASLHGAWLLGRPDRRSAFFAWCSGLVQALKSPVNTFGTLAVWGLPAAMLLVLPLLVGVLVPAMRGGVVGTVVLHLTAAAVAFCQVALFISFAPVSGLLNGKDENPNT